MNCKDVYLSERIVKAINNKKIVFFVGAGISKGAGIPTGNEVKELLIKRYPKKFKKNREYGYIDAFNKVFPGMDHKADRRKFIEELCSGKSPGMEHQIIAHLVEHKKIMNILTTNFDHLTEIALLIRCSLQPGVYLYDDEIEPLEYLDENPKVFKLHGDFLFDDLANLKEEMRNRLNDSMRSRLSNYLKDRGLIVLGYSGTDKTIMDFLIEIVQTTECIKHGLWWIIFKNEELNNKKLIKLIETAQKQNKFVEIVGPIGAVDFLMGLSDKLGMGPPEPIPFGIKSKQVEILDNYLGFYRRSRQKPPIKEDKNIYINVSDDLLKLEKKLKSPGIIWLMGPPGSGKSTLIGEFYNSLSDKNKNKLFYFSPIFSRKPISYDLNIEIRNFADSIGISSIKLKFPNYLETEIFKKEAILVFDDIFSICFHKNMEYWERIIQLIKAQIFTNKGNVILVTSRMLYKKDIEKFRFELTDSSLNKKNLIWIPSGEINISTVEIYPKNNFTKNKLSKDIKVNPIKQISEKCLKVLNVFSQLRFAQPINILKGLFGISDLQRILDDLHISHILEKRGNNYAMRDHIKAQFSNSVSTPDLNHKIAQSFEKIFKNMPYFQASTLRLEVEYHFWEARKPKEAILQILKIEKWLFETNNAKFLYFTIKDFLELKEGIPILKSLKVIEQIQIVLSFYESFILSKIKDPSFNIIYSMVRGELISNLIEVDKYFFFACESYKNNNYRKNIEYLFKAEKILSSGNPTEMLGEIQLKISGGLIDNMTIYGTHENIKEIIKDSLFWAKKAEQTYLKIGSQKLIAYARDAIASCFLNLGEISKAYEIEKEQVIIHAIEGGFSEIKGVAYGNLFLASLNLGNLKEAEGYFHESNLNFARMNKTHGLLVNYGSLFNYIFTKNVDKEKLPKPRTLYYLILNNVPTMRESQDFYQTKKIICSALRLWFNHNLKRKKLGYTLEALKNFLNFSYIFLHKNETLYEGMFMINRIVLDFKKKVKKKQILEIINKVASSHFNIYACFLEWVMNPQMDLHRIVKKYKLDKGYDGLEQGMQKIWEICYSKNRKLTFIFHS